jgi:DNA-binding transcriptional LysR family regulator
MTMDWDKLRIFHMVAEAGSFTHAGESLNLSQSVVSRHIGSLEESLGVTLFHRHARGLILTEQGEMLHKASREIFARLAMVEGQLSDSKDHAEGKLSITIAEFLGTAWLAPLVAEFHIAYPDINLTVLVDDRVLNLGMRAADAAIRLYKPEGADLVQKQIATLHFGICAHTSYIARCGKPTSPGQLKDHTLIAYPPGALVPYQNPNWLVDQVGLEGETAANVLQVNSVSTIYSAVCAGAGIATLPKFMLRNNPDLVEILPNLTPPSVDMYFVYPEERRHSRRISLFRDFIAERIASSGF